MYLFHFVSTLKIIIHGLPSRSRAESKLLVLCYRSLRLRRNPIGLGEFNAPEVGRRSEEFDADALALFGIGLIAEINNAAFLVFLRKGVRDDEECAHFDGLLSVEKSAMSIDYNRLAGLAELAVQFAFAGHYYTNAHEHARTAAIPLIPK